jgi:hypothetical protein
MSYFFHIFIIFTRIFYIIGDIPEKSEYLDYLPTVHGKKEHKKQVIEPNFQVPDEKWTSNALKDIAYSLRHYKFNEWDQRYYEEKPKEHLLGYFDSFPVPILRSLHWKVYKNCENNFYKCITYLHSVITTEPFGRRDDVVTLLSKKDISNKTLIKNLNYECKEAEYNSERNTFPFDSRIEKFQWRTSASYYMCWYTMLGTPVLSMLGEACDNFANCLDPEFGERNHDPRSNDRLAFACAIYSFCPDPCCPLKHIHDHNQCNENKSNPCFNINRKKQTTKASKCTLDKKDNRNLKAIINNKWNVSCDCDIVGFTWKSQYGICVDINECLDEKNMCNNKTEDCFNTLGSYRCICKWGYQFDSNKNNCISSNVLINVDDNLRTIKNNNSIVDVMFNLLKYIDFRT